MMMSNFSKDKKEALRIASRFLKEVGLYDLWIRYCYDHRTSKSWIKKPLRYMTDILGQTCFTEYVRKHKPSFVIPEGYCIYEFLGEYIKKKYPEYSTKVQNSSRGCVIIDKERKRVYLTANSDIW